MSYQRQSGSPIGGIGSILFMVFFFIALYYIATGIFKLLLWVAPLLFIVTLFIDYKVIVDYGKWLLNLTKRNPVMGAIAILLSIGFYPVLAFFLLGKAFFKKKVKEVAAQFEEATGASMNGTKHREEEFVDYEDVTDEKEVKLELPPLQKPEPRRNKPNKDNEYDSFFE